MAVSAGEAVFFFHEFAKNRTAEIGGTELTNIILCGDPDDTSICEALLPALSLYGGVRYFSPYRVLERGISAEFFLYECDQVPQIELAGGILLMKNSVRQQTPVAIPSGFLCVLETKNSHAVALLKDTDAAVVTCGTGGKDTLSIAGLESTGAALSLQRSLATVGGKILEPHDFNVRFSQERSPHQILFVCAALLISGVDSADGYII